MEIVKSKHVGCYGIAKKDGKCGCIDKNGNIWKEMYWNNLMLFLFNLLPIKQKVL